MFIILTKLYDNILEVIDPKMLEKLNKTYGEDNVAKAIAYLSYKTASVLPKNESDIKPTLYVFRHGQTDDNANYIFSGWRDAKLTDKGREQALLLAEKMKDKKIDMLIASTQTRAIETMRLVMSKNPAAKDLEIHEDVRIRERSYGDWAGTSKLEAHLSNPKLLEDTRRNYYHAPPNGESIEMVCKRVFAFCDEIVPLMKEHKINVAVSCHGNSIRGFRQYFEKLSNEETAEVETPLGQDYLAYVVE